MASDTEFLRALVHDAQGKLQGLSSQSLGVKAELDDLRKVVGLAERFAARTADDQDRQAVPNTVHPQVRSFYLP